MSTEHWQEFEIGDELIAQGLPYDYASIMHYGHCAGSKNGQPTILPINHSIQPKVLSGSELPSEYDYLHVNLLYCGGENVFKC